MLSTKIPSGKICTSTLCMESRLSDEEVHKHKKALLATMVDRRSPDNPQKILMKAAEAKRVLRAGTSVDMLEATGLTKSGLPNAYDIELMPPKELLLNAQWRNQYQERAESASNASVFGKLGVLAIPSYIRKVSIPKMNALAVPKAFLEKYGAELISSDQPVQIEPASDESLKTLYLVEYHFHKKYVEQYALKTGGGLFVEKHPFPQIFMPLPPQCSGALILGIETGPHQFSFASFEIAFGFTMKIKSMTIHGDSFFVGPYAIALTDTELADSVLFRRNTKDRAIQPVEQVRAKPAKPPLLAEMKLAKKVDEDMMVNKIRHDSQHGQFTVKFFKKLPPDVLRKVKNVSPEAQQAFRKVFNPTR